MPKPKAKTKQGGMGRKVRRTRTPGTNLLETAKERRARRLKLLACDMILFPPERDFNQGDWGSHEGGDHKPSASKNYCGTQVCTLGNAALNPQFQKEGLIGKWLRDAEDDGDGGYSLRISFTPPGVKREKVFLDAGKAFFGITEHEALRIFGGHGSYRLAGKIQEILEIAGLEP